jgi:hypothetical protein
MISAAENELLTHGARSRLGDHTADHVLINRVFP